MNKRTFFELAEKLKEAFLWISSLGIHFDQTRIGQYERIISTYLKNIEAGIENKIQHDRFLAVCFEAMSFVEVFENFPRKHERVLVSKLKTVLKGPLFQEEEIAKGKSSEARNIQYELVLASKLNKTGLEIDFSNGYKEDLNFEYGGERIYCECKRPFTDAGLQKAFKESMSQLRKRFTIGKPGEKGIIAVSISRLSNVRNSSVVFDSPQLAVEAINQHITEKMRPFASLMDSKKEPKIAGMFCSFYTPIAISSMAGDLISVNVDGCIPFGKPGSESYAFLRNFSTEIDGWLN